MPASFAARSWTRHVRAKRRVRPEGGRAAKAAPTRSGGPRRSPMPNKEIRPLLLTFFDRQMPELVEHGHVYIAQPPLYKVKLGKQERYFKDDHERAQFMLAQALVGASLAPKKGAQAIEGKTLEQLAKAYLFAEAVVARASKIIDVEALAALIRGAKVTLSNPHPPSPTPLPPQHACAPHVHVSQL